MPEGRMPRGVTPRPRSGVAAGRSYPSPRSGVAAERSYPTLEARGGGREEQPHARVQGWQPGGPNPCPRSGGCTGAGGSGGAIPR